MLELKGEETQPQILAAISEGVWPHGGPTRPQEIVSRLRKMAERDEGAREPLQRAARFVELSGERGDSSTGRFAAREAHAVITCFVRGDFKGVGWEQALADLGHSTEMRRSTWPSDEYLAGDFVSPQSSAFLADPAEYPHRDEWGNPFRLKLWPEGNVYALTQEDAQAQDWRAA